MQLEKVERIDHLGIVSGIMKDLGIVEMIDSRIGTDSQEEITTGEAIAGMLLNGLGFTSRPMYLSPQFFENKPLSILFREGVKAAHLNRFKLSRSLDKIYQYGSDMLFGEIALNSCEKEGIDLKYNSLDTSTYSLIGEYVPEDEQAMRITYGYSKDHRPDLKQAVIELVVSHDGGVPFISKIWDGNESDTEIFKERSKSIIESFKNSETPRYLTADCKLYTKENAVNLARLIYVTRIPGILKQEQEIIEKALEASNWQVKDEKLSYQSFSLSHYGIDQRWIVCYSKPARDRAEKSVQKACNKEKKKVEKQLFHLQAQRFESKETAEKELSKIKKKLKYHKISGSKLTVHKKYEGKGRPASDAPVKSIKYQIEAKVEVQLENIRIEKEKRACFVIGTNAKKENLSDDEAIDAYKGQSNVEKGFRFLKDPLFFVSSLFVKKPSRIQALLMVMTLALLVYSIAERRLRKALADQKETIPNQIKQPTDTPTLRWVFQLLEGINLIFITIENQTKIFIEGLNDLREKIITYFGQNVRDIYQIVET